jgi:lysine 6-dehydrogenase
MCQDYEGRVTDLEYKTLRYPGHGEVFAAMRELGMFDTDERLIDEVRVTPRSVLLDLLATHLPQGEPDVVLVRVSVTAGEWNATTEMVDVHDGRFSALARTTAFPATALCDLVTRGDVEFRGAAAMHRAVGSDQLLPELEPAGLEAVET